MSYTLGVHEAQRRGNLANYLRGGRFAKALVLLYAAQQLAAVNLKSMLVGATALGDDRLYLLEDEIELVVVFEELGEVDDVGMALAVVERLDLTEDTGARMSRHLVNDLNCKLLVCVHVEARLDAGVRALAQYLARQLVQIYKICTDLSRQPQHNHFLNISSTWEMSNSLTHRKQSNVHAPNFFR